MKEGISSLDLMYLARELSDILIGGWIRNIKQIGKTFYFEIFKEKKFFLKVILGSSIYTTGSSEPGQTPPTFCMQLRKHLTGKQILSFVQHEFDRIAEMEVPGFKVIFELFSRGNLILIDSSGMIVGIFEEQTWKDRILKVKRLYKYPPSGINPFKYEFFEFQKVLREIERPLGLALAVNFGLGGLYSEEFVKRVGIEKSKNTRLINQAETDRIIRLFEEWKDMKPKGIVVKKKEIIDVVPFELVTYKDYDKDEFQTFNEAVRVYFEGYDKMKREKLESLKLEKESERIKIIKQKQLDQLKNSIEKQELYKKSAQFLYEHYESVSSILKEIRNMLDMKKSWVEIERQLKNIDIFKKVIPEEGKVVIRFEGRDIEIDFRKTIEQNVNNYYEQAKKLNEKIEKLKRLVEEVPEVKKIEISAEITSKAKKPSKKWYERYRWFVSSNGLLVVAGKNARNNETIIKRYTKPQDLVLHVDIHGSPFVVIKNEKKLSPLPAETIYEAAEFAAAYSRAWEQKIGTISVYYVKPEQVVKEGGLPTGSFMIKGERKWLEKIKPRLSIGIKQEDVFDARLIYGPVTAVKKQTPYMITVMIGDEHADQLSLEIKKELVAKVPSEIRKWVEDLNTEEIKKLIPYGKGQLVK